MYDELDTNVIDPAVVRKLDGIESEQGKATKELKEASKAIDELQAANAGILAKQFADNAAQQVQEQRRAANEKVLNHCNEEFGDTFQDEAIRLANEKIKDKGDPADEIEAFRLLQGCYKEAVASAKKDGEKTSTKTTDLPIEKDEIKEGSLDEVMSQIRNKYKGRGKAFTVPSP